ncbi:MAG TPA: 4'-phosphopantetheinyl transferase superfamily protein [Bdellovibrionota bacterium]|nr:4'-phosphopantetheinyl transferase superfamily protein [Bdellovibrionota bacterium]
MGSRTERPVLEILRETALHDRITGSLAKGGAFAFAARRERGFLLPAQSRKQVDFDAGRLCARRALEKATGSADHVIPRGDDRAPVWPQGFHGSITHTDRFVAAVVAPRTDLKLGVDAEEWLSVRACEEVEPQVCVGTEVQAVEKVLSLTRPRAVTLIFSAKEALYKALAPSVGRYFDFQDAQVADVRRAEGERSAELDLVLLTDLGAELLRGSRVTALATWDDERAFCLILN